METLDLTLLHRPFVFGFVETVEAGIKPHTIGTLNAIRTALSHAANHILSHRKSLSSIPDLWLLDFHHHAIHAACPVARLSHGSACLA